MKKLSELTLMVNGNKVTIDPQLTITLKDSMNNYYYYASDQILVGDSESQPGNMDIVKQYIDDLRHISGIKKENQ